MSRYAIEGYDRNHAIVVGYDPPLRTFFAQVTDLSVPIDQDSLIFWVGVAPYGVPTVERLQALMQGYVTLTALQVHALRQDQATSPQLTSLQHTMLAFLEDHQPQRTDLCKP